MNYLNLKSITEDFFIFIFIIVCYLNICVCTTCMQKPSEVLNLLELELWMAMSQFRCWESAPGLLHGQWVASVLNCLTISQPPHWSVFNLLQFMYVCLCINTIVYAMCVYEDHRTAFGSLFSPPCFLRWTRVRLGDRWLYLLSHLTGSRVLIFKYFKNLF